MKIMVWKEDGAVVKNIRCDDGITVRDEVTFTLVTTLNPAEDLLQVTLDVCALLGTESCEFERGISPQPITQDHLIDFQSFFAERGDNWDGDILLAQIFDQIIAPAATLTLHWHYADGDHDLVEGVEMRLRYTLCGADYDDTFVIELEEAESYFVLEEDPEED